MCDYHNQWNDISLCEKCWIFRITRLLGRVEQTVAGLIWRQRPLYKLFMIIQDTMIKQEISALFRELVKEVNGIYKTSDFAGQEGFQLRVDRLAVSFLSYLYLSLMFRIRRVAPEHLRTTVFHSSLSSAYRMVSLRSRLVHPLKLSSQFFLAFLLFCHHLRTY